MIAHTKRSSFSRFGKEREKERGRERKRERERVLIGEENRRFDLEKKSRCLDQVGKNIGCERGTVSLQVQG